MGFWDQLDRWLIERIILVIFATLLVHTLYSAQDFIIQMFGAVIGIATFEVGSLLLSMLRSRKGHTA